MNKKLKFSIMALFVAGIAALSLPSGFASSGGIKWRSYEDGLSAAKNDSKKLLVTFYADWCTYCKVMDRETFKDMEVVKYINDNFVPIRVNSDTERDTANTFKVRGLPDTWFISEDQEVIGHRAGYIPAETMIQVLQYINTNSYKEMSFQNFVDSRK